MNLVSLFRHICNKVWISINSVLELCSQALTTTNTPTGTKTISNSLSYSTTYLHTHILTHRHIHIEITTQLICWPQHICWVAIYIYVELWFQAMMCHTTILHICWPPVIFLLVHRGYDFFFFSPENIVIFFW